MVDMIAEVVLEQIFANPYNSTVVDCEYAFPMDNRAVLKDLIVTIGDRKILGQVEERKKVKYFQKTYLVHLSLIMILLHRVSSYYIPPSPPLIDRCLRSCYFISPLLLIDHLKGNVRIFEKNKQCLLLCACSGS